jgi:hypothetical protein
LLYFSLLFDFDFWPPLSGIWAVEIWTYKNFVIKRGLKFQSLFLTTRAPDKLDFLIQIRKDSINID